MVTPSWSSSGTTITEASPDVKSMMYLDKVALMIVEEKSLSDLVVSSIVGSASVPRLLRIVASMVTFSISEMPKTLKASMAASISVLSINVVSLPTGPVVIRIGLPKISLFGTTITSSKSSNCLETVAWRIAEPKRVPALSRIAPKSKVSILLKSSRSITRMARKMFVNSSVVI